MFQGSRITAFSLLLCTWAQVYADVPPHSAAIEAVRNDLKTGQADHGLQTLDQVLKQQPQNAEAYNLRCRIYMQERRWDDAIASCKAAVAVAPDNSDYNLWLARAMGEKADRVSFITAFKMARQIHQEFETAARLDPHNVQALSDLGQFYVEAPAVVGGGVDKAQGIVQQLDAISPEHAHILRARIAENKKNYSQAEQELKSAIAAAKQPSSAWMELALFYYRHQRWDEMVQAVHSGASADTQNTFSLVDGASMLVRAKRDLPFARQILERYLASSNQSEDAPAFRVHAELGKLLTQLGDTQGAQQQFAATQELAKDYQIGSQSITNTGR
jgi:tetratricopeptide (TPR) repeat protein